MPPLETYRRKRDFSATAEPRGAALRPATPGSLRFVIQKHAASHLHFDLRLELDGVMKSWAVPKGPSIDPQVKRLAMQVEDHPIEYNRFEGTIPEGEYGGGTVMIWDRGTYEPLEGGLDELREAFKKGTIKFLLHGERLHGSWALVRMNRGAGRQWLLIKHRDRYARTGGNIVGRVLTSVATQRTMKSIAGEERARARSAVKTSERRAPTRTTPTRVIPRLEPMLARLGTSLPEGKGWTFEPKYDGIRVLAFADGDAVSLVTRNQLDKASQFPDIAGALTALSRKKRRPFVLDGEIVAYAGRVLGRFQELQERIHETNSAKIAGHIRNSPAALIAFDLLMEGVVSYVKEPLATRRATLEKLFARQRSPALRLGVSIEGGGDRLLEKATKEGWEGIMAKRLDAPYRTGKRSDAWLKLKLEARQEFVVGGWTEPRRSREHIGSLLLGYWKRGKLIYAGHTGAGFSRRTLADLAARLAPLERKTSAFETEPRPNAPAHWTRPEVVVEIKFNEWTAGGRLRRPVFLGVRDDKDARTVVREGPARQRQQRRVRPAATARRTVQATATSRATAKGAA
ncbi:MAG TPA: non-homologous end-joining DNA ligase [Gemmatimonadaceae bacterium]|nr:non-homologous end-joining DNA ligase [Gemmatimonadaceae bacterium]